MNILEQKIEQFCLDCEYDPAIDAIKTKTDTLMLVRSGIFVFFSDSNDVCIAEDGNKVFIDKEGAPEFFTRLGKYRTSGGKASIKQLKEKYDQDH